MAQQTASRHVRLRRRVGDAAGEAVERAEAPLREGLLLAAAGLVAPDLVLEPVQAPGAVREDELTYASQIDFDAAQTQI